MDDPPFTITGDVPEWLDVIHCGQVTPTHGGFKSAGEDKSAVPSCYESGDSTSLSGSDNTSEGGKELHVKDGYHGRYSFRSRDEVRGDDASCRITRMCVARHSSNRSTGFEPGVVVVETNEDELPEVFVTADSTQSFSGEVGTHRRCSLTMKSMKFAVMAYVYPLRNFSCGPAFRHKNGNLIT